MTASTPRRVSRTEEVSIRYSDSGVVIRMSGGFRPNRARSACGVSPLRIPMEMRSPHPNPASGFRRFRPTSTPSAFNGET